MTQKRRYNARCHECNIDALCPLCGKPVSPATPFSDWLRRQPEIDSGLGFTSTNLDYVWRNYKTGQWMLIEEKRFMATVPRWQMGIFKILNWCARKHPRYKGLFIIRFERTNPEDGKIYLSGNEITQKQLIAFLRFETEV